MVKFGQYLKHNIVPEWREKVLILFDNGNVVY